MKYMKSLFIVFEGLDGTGKSTQAKLLCDFLNKRNHPSIYVKHPSGAVRSLLLHKSNEDLTEKSQALLFAADAANTHEKIIKPALQQNKFVICDRYIYSNYAYRKSDDFLKELCTYAVDGLEPDLVFLLDAAVKNIISRQDGRDRYERASIVEQQDRRGRYLKIANRDPNIFFRFNALLNKHVIQEEVRKIVDRKIISKNL